MKEIDIRFTPICDWNIFEEDAFPIISGPCAAENIEQVLTTASHIANIGVNVFRAGLWKPRTRPGSFEGVGKKGLPWLMEAKERFGLKTIVEVASKKNVEDALSHGVDMVWIGARTTSNPFLVEELAQALKDSNIPILVKNPISPDLNLWIGAIERLSRVGITKIGAIHRGFHPFNKTKYRNEPNWETALMLRSIYPELPIFVDPSHIAGDKAYIKELSQKAIDFGFDGLMIECHYNPSIALSDNKQQLTPMELEELLNKELLFVKTNICNSDSVEIANMRTLIDIFDENILHFLSLRMKACSKIGKYKRDKSIAIFQKTRWESVLKSIIQKGKELGLSTHLVRDMYNLIHRESILLQKHIIEDDE